MKDRDNQANNLVNHLIEAIVQKLEANRMVLIRSQHFGRLSWRRNKKNGEIEVDLELKL